MQHRSRSMCLASILIDYTVVTKATKEFIDASGRRKVKGNMDVELAVDAMELAERIDEMVLFSGDGDFRSLVEAVQRLAALQLGRPGRAGRHHLVEHDPARKLRHLAHRARSSSTFWKARSPSGV